MCSSLCICNHVMFNVRVDVRACVSARASGPSCNHAHSNRCEGLYERVQEWLCTRVQVRLQMRPTAPATTIYAYLRMCGGCDRYAYVHTILHRPTIHCSQNKTNTPTKPHTLVELETAKSKGLAGQKLMALTAAYPLTVMGKLNFLQYRVSAVARC